ncbi:unnamed protein product [Lampetra planeri]
MSRRLVERAGEKEEEEEEREGRGDETRDARRSEGRGSAECGRTDEKKAIERFPPSLSLRHALNEARNFVNSLLQIHGLLGFPE